MGEAYLDSQKKGGIKLNDVIEEYRYVAAGKTVKKGDFLVYAGEEVLPATQPPFNAIALSGGAGGTEVKIARVYRMVNKTGNIFGNKNWTKISNTEYKASDGSKITSSVAPTKNTLEHVLMSASTTSDRCEFEDLASGVIIELTLPEPIKARIMGVYYVGGGAQISFKAYVEENNNWVDLYKESGPILWFTPENIDVSNPVLSAKYRIELLPTSDGEGQLSIENWRTIEYEEVIQ